MSWVFNPFTSTLDWTNSASSTFIGLTDVPATYVGQALELVRVNAAETALEFVPVASLGVATLSFTTIACSLGTNPVADSATDTLNLSSGNGVSVTGTIGTDTVAFALASLSTNWQATIDASSINFRNTQQKIYSSAADNLDLDGNQFINFRQGTVTVCRVQAGAFNIEDLNALSWGSGNVYMIGDSFSNNLDIVASTITFGGADLSGIDALSMANQLTNTLVTGTAPFVINSTTLVSNLNADLLDGLDSTAFELAQTKGNLTATTPISLSATRQVIGGAAVISHDTTAGNIHLPTGGSANQLLKNSGVSGTGAWGTVTENAGALAAITTISMSGQLTSTLATGTAPFVVASTTLVTNLNADLLDGLSSTGVAALSGWQDDGTVVRLVTTTDEVVFGGSAALSSAKVSIDGDTDQIQLIIQGEASQTADLLVLETSAGTDLWNVNASGHTTWATTGEARFRASSNRVYSRAADTLTVEGNTMTEVGKDGNIRLGTSTLRIMYPSTDNKIDLGQASNRFNDCFFGQITITDAKNIVLNTTTGTQLATSTSQKLGFWGKAPTGRPAAYTPTNITTDRSYDCNSTTIDELADVLASLITDLQSIGLIG